MIITSLQIKKSVLAKGYIWNNGGVNIVGIRNSDTGNAVTNLFDDTMTLTYTLNNELKFEVWKCTTDPGKKGVMEYHNAKGVARMVPGQYHKSHAIGLHQGKYEALVQVSPVKVWRDANKDLVYNETVIDEGLFGINIHHAGADSTLVENWSEGCQVFKTIADFEQFMSIMRALKDANMNLFTYTLLTSKDILPA